MNWIISDHEATCFYNGHAFIATATRAVVLRAGIVVAEKTDTVDIVHAMVWCQNWAGVRK